MSSKQALAALTAVFLITVATAFFLLWYVGVHEYAHPLEMMR